MIVGLYIFLAIVAVGVVLKMTDRLWPASSADKTDEESLQSDAKPFFGNHGDDCCGQHAVCTRDSLLMAMSKEIEYFEDEELDAFAGRSPEDYTAEEADMFRDVLLTLRPDEIAAWGRSVQLRGIELPTDIRDEFLILIEDVRR